MSTLYTIRQTDDSLTVRAGGPGLVLETNLGAPFAVFASGAFDFCL